MQQPPFGSAPPPPYGNMPHAPPPYGNMPHQPQFANDQFNSSSPYEPTHDAFLGNNPMSFDDVRIRHGFIKKVYSIVSLQMLVTTIVVTCFVSIESMKGFFYTNPWILYLFMAGTFVVMIVLACCESVARKHPLNLILLGVFTVLESFLIGAISSRYNTDTLLIAVGITFALVLGLTIFAFQTKIDFTGCGVYLFVIALLFFVFGIFAIIFRSKILHVIYAALGAGIFSIYLVFDTQLMMGGKHKYSISPEDYVMAALNLYVDIIQLFLMILRLVGAAKD